MGVSVELDDHVTQLRNELRKRRGFLPDEMLDALSAILMRPWMEFDWQSEHVHFGGNVVINEPTISDGLFYPGSVNMLHGQDGTGKSLIALHAAWLEVYKKKHVFWINYEDTDATEIIRRFQAQVARFDADLLNQYMHVWSPGWHPMSAGMPFISRHIESMNPSLIVLDSLGEAVALDGIDENRDGEVAAWLRNVARQMADAGPAVCLIDHATKANDNPLFSSGSKRKRAVATGVVWSIGHEDDQPFSQGRSGFVTMTVAKDRRGHYRRGDTPFRFIVTAEPSIDIMARADKFEVMLQHLVPGEAYAERRRQHETTVEEAFQRVLRDDPGANQTTVLAAVRLQGVTPKMSREQWLIHLRDLLARGLIRVVKEGRTTAYYWREDELP